jgi:hypothetical protein
LTKALTHSHFLNPVKAFVNPSNNHIPTVQSFGYSSESEALKPVQSPLGHLLPVQKSCQKPMTFISAPSRFWPRMSVLGALSLLALVGFAGAVNTVGVWNGSKAEELAQADEMADAVAAIKAKEAEVKAQTDLAASYSELGLAQATCADTLAQFYFQPGVSLAQQLQQWGFDFGAPRYNADQWVPLFDSAGLLSGAVRRDPATGQQVFVQADEQPLDQAAICNSNQLTKE